MPDHTAGVANPTNTFTADAAWAGFQEAELGTIENGKFADLTVLDRDILRIPTSEILETKVTFTVVEGEIVYSSR